MRNAPEAKSEFVGGATFHQVRTTIGHFYAGIHRSSNLGKVDTIGNGLVDKWPEDERNRFLEQREDVMNRMKEIIKSDRDMYRKYFSKPPPLGYFQKFEQQQPAAIQAST